MDQRDEKLQQLASENRRLVDELQRLKSDLVYERRKSDLLFFAMGDGGKVAALGTDE